MTLEWINAFPNQRGFMSCAPTEMFRTAFWMHHYGHPNSKRTKLWAPSWYICLFNQGPLKKSMKRAKGPATAEKYIDGSGRLRYKGTKALKSTQFPS